MNKHCFFKFALCGMLIVLVAVFVLRGLIWQRVVSYEDFRCLSLQSLTDKNLREKILVDTKGMEGKEIIAYCRNLTSNSLSFSLYSAEKNINRMYPHAKTHCVGYAAFFASICKYAFSANSIDGKVSHVRGYVHILGMDIHAPFRNVPSLKDHDYVVVLLEGEKIYVDPSIEDVFFLK